MAPSAFGGYLYSKRKSELEEIALAMKLNLPEAGYVKSDLEDLIRDALKSSPKIRQDPRFIELWERMPESRRVEDDSDNGAKRTPRSAIKQVAEVASPVVNSVTKRANEVTKSASTTLSRSANVVSRELVTLPTPQALVKMPSLSVRKAQDAVVSVVAESQDIMVADWAPTVLALAIEFGYLFYGAVPYTTQKIGPHKWLTRSSTPSFSVQVPKFEAMYSQTFGLTVAYYALWTIALPLVLSLFIAPAPVKSVGRGRSAPRMSPPGPIPFHLFRLAVVLVRGYLFASYKPVEVLKDMARGHGQSWSFESVKAYPAVQLVSSALALAITMYHEFY